MPHAHTDRPRREHGWGWLQPTTPLEMPVETIDEPTDPDNTTTEQDKRWQWLPQPFPAVPPSAAVASATRPPTRTIPRHVWVGLTAVLGIATALVTAGVAALADEETTAAVVPTGTAGPPASAAPPARACTGLSGQVVTDTVGDTRDTAGIIATFEHAYYSQRDAEAALRLVAPEAGLKPDTLAAGIDTVPAGTTHCVAITEITTGTAEVHVVELRPDGQRIDYLQLINTRHQPGAGAVIVNIQKRG